MKEGKNLTVSNLEGSIFRWSGEGRPLVDPKGKSTRLVHPYNPYWGRLLDPEAVPPDFR